ncbi:hypothetical protein H4Q26_000504 [Puccinia striiformis f. sp. tritici PST-130]|nr:hypothetical protein H4Q26_000504 [Puccinia striiformis f. sp. tritici PST-130]
MGVSSRRPARKRPGDLGDVVDERVLFGDLVQKGHQRGNSHRRSGRSPPVLWKPIIGDLADETRLPRIEGFSEAQSPS